MAKKKTKGAAASAAALTAAEFQKLSPEEQAAKLEALQAENAKLKAGVKSSGKEELPSFEVDADEEAEIEGGDYQFTCPTFQWDDGKVIDVRKLMAEAESDDKKAAEKASAIMSELVARKSGIVKRKED